MVLAGEHARVQRGSRTKHTSVGAPQSLRQGAPQQLRRGASVAEAEVPQELRRGAPQWPRHLID